MGAHRRGSVTAYPPAQVIKSETNPNANHNDIEVCKAMKVISQEDVYVQCGQKIEDDLLEGSAVVIFAYGLSGSGKTYTVFGGDDINNMESWYYLENAEAKGGDQWGIFPRLAYSVMDKKMQHDGWKVSSESRTPAAGRMHAKGRAGGRSGALAPDTSSAWQ